MSYVSSSSISILMNGRMLKKFKPSKEDHKWQPTKSSRNDLVLSHVIFADDIILLGRAEGKTAKSIHEVLMTFCGESGQTINLKKSKVFFSTNTKQYYKKDITNLLGINETLDLERYLSFPIHKGRVSKNDYAFIINKVRAKKDEDKNRLHLLNWSEVTKKKSEGGLDLRETQAQNQAQLVKLENNTLIKASKVSTTWKAMRWIGLIVEKGIGRVIADGSSTSFEHDNWLGFENNINDIPTQLKGQGQDSICWSASSSGVFTTQSAYDLTRGISLNENKEIWLERNRRNCRQNGETIDLVKLVIAKAVKFFTMNQIGVQAPLQSFMSIRRNPPNDGWYKLNTNGSTLGNPEKARVRAIIRDNEEK
ncbi:uncharacterized protein LOC111292571 [Durio zibethinus]|uniref:Uncharacterized protein LOC111292571 n=1 Tax=Durio zibethinus TaxID=66656 RepID=A0A6P5YKD2_DURZI|nr:uncharacterized protein LOC111292571 [Durio zibethinus]